MLNPSTSLPRSSRRLTVTALIALLVGAGCDRPSVPVAPAQPPPPPIRDPIPAFPGAGGYGAGALNDCDREALRVFPVTSLEDDGPGTLRHALAAAESSPEHALKIILFRTGGYIEVTRALRFGAACLYIAGQTAPGDGITVTGGGLEFDGDARDIVVRFLRVRPGLRAGSADGIVVRAGTNLIFDHLSIAWSPGSLLRFSRTPISRSGRIQNVTIQRSLLGESLAAHPTAIQMGGQPDTDAGSGTAGWRYLTRFSVHQNALISNSHRNVNARGVGVEVINNVVHNWNLDAGQTGREAVVDWVNNHFTKGPMSRDIYRPIAIRSVHVLDAPFYSPSLYVSGNVSLGGELYPDQNPDPDADNWNGDTRLVDWFHNDPGGAPLSPFRRDQRLATEATFPVRPRDPYQARAAVLDHAGASQGVDCMGQWFTRRDGLDMRMVEEARSGTGWEVRPGPSDEDAAGGLPDLELGAGCTDVMNTGLPEEWKRTHGLDPSDASLAARIGAGGYTHLEHYLNGTPP